MSSQPYAQQKPETHKINQKNDRELEGEIIDRKYSYCYSFMTKFIIVSSLVTIVLYLLPAPGPFQNFLDGNSSFHSYKTCVLNTTVFTEHIISH
jgi:hypothetical protein